MVFELLALDFNSPINKSLTHCRAVQQIGEQAWGLWELHPVRDFAQTKTIAHRVRLLHHDGL
jgi:hypothetical protein